MDVAAVAVALAILSVSALRWFAGRGELLYFGDAVSHLNTARRIIDSRTPGLDQFGSPWLPLPHLLMIPFVRNDDWWQSGLAGGIPSAICFVAAGLFLWGSVRIALDSRIAAACSAALFALNPNVLYMQSIPMTETVFFAAVCGLLFMSLWFRQSGSWLPVAGAGLMANAAALTRYEGWVLLPAVALFILFAAPRRRFFFTAVFCVVAALGPLLWLAYNAWYAGDWLEFYRGPYSAKAIYERAIRSGMARAPGDQDWSKAVLYYATAARLNAGWPLAVLGTLGICALIVKRAVWTLLFLLLPCAFYVLGIHSTGNPIFVPELWPHSYYNTRYGLIAVLLLATGAGALISLLPGRLRVPAALVVVAMSLTPWLWHANPEAWITWKESQVNSEARREWTSRAASFLRSNYRTGEGIFTSFGDLSGVFESAGIPLRETLYDGNNPAWLGAAARPSLLLHEEWALALAGDSVATAVQRGSKHGPRYRLVQQIIVKNSPVVEIYKRD